MYRQWITRAFALGNRCAVAAIDQPFTITQSTILRRPSGVNGAFGCCVLA